MMKLSNSVLFGWKRTVWFVGLVGLALSSSFPMYLSLLPVTTAFVVQVAVPFRSSSSPKRTCRSTGSSRLQYSSHEDYNSQGTTRNETELFPGSFLSSDDFYLSNLNRNNNNDDDDGADSSSQKGQQQLSFDSASFVLVPTVPSCFHPTNYTKNNPNYQVPPELQDLLPPPVPTSFWNHWVTTHRHDDCDDDNDNDDDELFMSQHRQSCNSYHFEYHPVPSTQASYIRGLYELQLLESLKESNEALPMLRALWQSQRKDKMESLRQLQQLEQDTSLSSRQKERKLKHMMEYHSHDGFVEPMLQLAKLLVPGIVTTTSSTITTFGLSNNTTNTMDTTTGSSSGSSSSTFKKPNIQPSASLFKSRPSTSTSKSSTTPPNSSPIPSSSPSCSPPPRPFEAMEWCLKGLQYKPWHFDLVDIVVQLCLTTGLETHSNPNRYAHAMYWSTYYALPPLNAHTNHKQRKEWVQRAMAHAQISLQQSKAAREYIVMKTMQQQAKQLGKVREGEEESNNSLDGTTPNAWE